MRVPLDWLREYCDPALDAKGIEERLTMTGTKVEAIHHHGVGAVEKFVVGRVLEVEKHPDADRLKVCKVDLGDDGDGGRTRPPARIVCGAPNVAVGQTVAVATPGAVMPDGTKIKQAKLRGVVSEGMICAETELDLSPPTSPSEGILVLDDLTLDAEFAPGTPLADVLPIAGEVLELEITPNRPDCLGVYGVARELHAATGAPLADAPWSEDSGSEGPVDGAEVVVECPDLCQRFTARVFEGVEVGPSPLWLKARLMAAGQKPINNVVDITNYAMLLTGQPLHAFDLDHVAGGRLTVRRAKEGEQVDTLDGETRKLDAEMVVIADADGPTSIAGVKGGARSEIRPETTRVLLEVATWSGPNIHRTSWSLGLRSEASGRFEKGLAPEQCMHAQAVASKLLIECCGARVAPGTIDVGWESAPELLIRLREARVQAILGLPVPRERQAEILEALDFQTVDDVGSGGARAGRTGCDGAGAATRGRHARGRFDRGGRADRRPGEAAGNVARAPRRRWAAQPRPEGAPRGRGRARRPRPARGGWLELHRPRPARPAAPARESPAAPGGAAGEPDVGDPVDDAPDIARLAAGCGTAQRRAQRAGCGDLRVRRRVPSHTRTAPRRSRSTTRSARC